MSTKKIFSIFGLITCIFMMSGCKLRGPQDAEKEKRDITESNVVHSVNNNVRTVTQSAAVTSSQAAKAAASIK